MLGWVNDRLHNAASDEHFVCDNDPLVHVGHWKDRKMNFLLCISVKAPHINDMACQKGKEVFLRKHGALWWPCGSTCIAESEALIRINLKAFMTDGVF